MTCFQGKRKKIMFVTWLFRAVCFVLKMVVAKQDPNTYSSQTNGELKTIFKDQLKTKKKLSEANQETMNLYLLSLVFSWFLFFFFSFLQTGRNADEGTTKLTTQRVKTQGLNTQEVNQGQHDTQGGTLQNKTWSYPDTGSAKWYCSYLFWVGSFFLLQIYR